MSANWSGGLGSKHYPTFLHSKQRDVTCLSRFLTFSNGGNKQKRRVLFFKALAQHIFKCVCNTAFLPISSILDTIYYLQGKRMMSVHLVMKKDEKACLPPTLPPHPSPIGRLIWSCAPFTVWSSDLGIPQHLFHQLATATKATVLEHTQTMLFSVQC